jgi:malate dehydrogenase (oxaloacetate-decarboxylating)(NADP+)
VRRVIDPLPGKRPFGLSVIVTKNRTVFMADTTVNESPSAEELADIAELAADYVRRLGHDPRVAFLSFSNFGNPPSKKTAHIQRAVECLDEKGVDFEYDGEMQADVALNAELRELYPFSKLSGPANILIMPALHSANIAYKLLTELGGGKIIGPVLLGMSQSVQIARVQSTASDIVNIAGIAASNARFIKQNKG